MPIPETIFDPETPLDAPEDGYELKPQPGVFDALHTDSRSMTRHKRDLVVLGESDTVLYGDRKFRYPIKALLLTPHFGPVRTAMSQALNAEYTIKHRPFVDPTRPEGYTHIVNEDDIPQQEGPIDNSKKKIEWRTNIYG